MPASSREPPGEHGVPRGPELRRRLEPRDYEALLRSVDGIVWEGDPQTFRFRFVSRAAERMLGHAPERWISEPAFWVEHIHPDDRDWVVTLCRKAIAEHRDHEFEYRMIAADGRTVWLRDICRLVLEDGEPVSARGVMVDISERKGAEQALRVADERLRAVVANAPVVLLALDAEGVVTLCEGKGLQTLGLGPEAALGRPVREMFGRNPQIRRHLERALAGEDFTAVVEFRDRVFHTHYTPVTNDAGEFNGAIGVATDVTERVEAERESQQLEAQVRHSQKLESLGVLAGGIAHDFNNLLMTVLGNADIALMDLGSYSPARVNVDRIREAAQRAAALTNELLAYSGHGPVQMRSLDLSQLVDGMADLLRVSISKKAVLHRDLAAELPSIEGDAGQLTQLVLNLITNASEALGDAAGRITLRTGVMEVDRGYLSQTYLREDLAEGAYVFLEVQDTGAGMDEETRSRLFDPFFSTKFTGRGLGLAAVLGIVRGHHGAISVYSEPGQGSLFRVLFPKGRRTREAGPERVQAEEGWRGRGTLLVVDDEPDVREIAQEMLQRLGFRVISARDGRQGLARFRAHADELAGVLLDLTMPEMSGEEVIRALREARPQLPIVVMSGFTEQDATAQVADAGPTGFVQKPFSRRQLALALRAALEKGK